MKIIDAFKLYFDAHKGSRIFLIHQFDRTERLFRCLAAFHRRFLIPKVPVIVVIGSQGKSTLSREPVHFEIAFVKRLTRA